MAVLTVPVGTSIKETVLFARHALSELDRLTTPALLAQPENTRTKKVKSNVRTAPLESTRLLRDPPLAKFVLPEPTLDRDHLHALLVKLDRGLTHKVLNAQIAVQAHFRL
jgi:hypothetical protein